MSDHCSYCGGARIVHSVAGDEDVACRVCLATDSVEPYRGTLGHESCGRELRRIAEMHEELLWLYGLFFDHVGTDASNVDPEGAVRFR